jgi:hypothetical protein
MPLHQLLTQMQPWLLLLLLLQLQLILTPSMQQRVLLTALLLVQ